MSDRKFVEDAVRSVADRYGFRAVRNRNFYVRQAETSGIINIQKSEFGPSFYLNAGLWLNSLSQDVPTAHYKYHVRWRIDSVADNETLADLREALDFSNEMPASIRRSIVSTGVEKNGFGLISALADEGAALQFVVATSDLFVFKEVRDLARHKLGYELQ